MSFWQYNKKKIILIAALSFFSPFLLLSVLFLYAFPFTMETIWFAALLAAIICIILSVVLVIRGVIYFGTINRLKEEETHLSVIPVFDKGYTILPGNADSRFSFTVERLSGTVAGFPLVISLRQGTRYMGFGTSVLICSFYPLTQPGAASNSSRSIHFNLGLSMRPKKDIKPEISEFVATLKVEGYTSVAKP